MTRPDEVLDFWLDEIGPEGWYKGSEEIDTACTERFLEACDAARNGAYRDWLSRPRTSLAYLILTDQFPRNIYRGSPFAFLSDRLALSAATLALAQGHDRRIEGVARQFFYLPFEHAESTQAQALSVCLFLTRIPDDDGDNLVHARAHREIIRRFGRFPTRNTALGRQSTAAEQRFIDEEGYGGVLQRLKPAA